MSLTSQSLLHAVSEVLSSHQKNKRESGADFNIFSILGLESDEVRLHSAFLGKLLDPKGEHGCGDEPLKAFLALKTSSLQFTPQTTKVYCELFAGELGRIDIAVTSDKNLLVIENKIYAKEQANQLGRYDEYAKKHGKQYEIYYLTLFGDNSKENTDLPDYKQISYAKDILHWLENLNFPQAVSTVASQYCAIIRKLTNQNDRSVEVEIEKLLVTKEAIMSATAISNAVGGAKAGFELKFWKELYEILKEPFLQNGFKMAKRHVWNFDEEDKKYIAEERTRSNGVVQMIFESKLSDSTFLEFYVEGGCQIAINYTVTVADEEGNSIKDSKIAQISKDIGLVRLSNNAYWEFHSQGIRLDGDGIYDLVDDAERAQVLKSVADEAIKYVSKLRNSL